MATKSTKIAIDLRSEREQERMRKSENETIVYTICYLKLALQTTHKFHAHTFINLPHSSTYMCTIFIRVSLLLVRTRTRLCELLNEVKSTTGSNESIDFGVGESKTK